MNAGLVRRHFCIRRCSRADWHTAKISRCYSAEQHTSRPFRVGASSGNTFTRPPPGLENMPWTGSPQQQQALEALKKRTEGFPEGQPDEEMLKWFLRDRSLDVEEAVGKLRKVTAWRSRVRPDALSEDDVIHQLAAGKDGKGEPEASRTFCAYLMENALQQLPPGTETVLGIFDFHGAGPQNVDLDYARFLVDMFFVYYPKRLARVLMVDAPWIFQPPWQLIKPLLRKYAALVEFVSAEELRRDYFAPGKAPKDFDR